MNELILALNATGIRYLLVGGQAMRLIVPKIRPTSPFLRN
jgi:hypothetical protein